MPLTLAEELAIIESEAKNLAEKLNLKMCVLKRKGDRIEIRLSIDGLRLVQKEILLFIGELKSRLKVSYPTINFHFNFNLENGDIDSIRIILR